MAKEVQSIGDQPQENPAEETEQSNNTLTSISLGRIMTSDSKPQAHRRARFKDVAGNWTPEITELAESIKKSGLINPITVRERHWRVFEGTSGPEDKKALWHVAEDARDYKRFIGRKTQAEAEIWAEQNRFEIVAGERRFLASGVAGLTEILCVVRELTDEQMLEIQLVENVQREDVNPVDEAFWYSEMTTKHSWTLPEIAARVGKDSRYIQTRLKLMAAIPEVLKAVEDKFLPMTHAIEIAKLDEDSQKQVFANTFQTKQELIDGKWQYVPIMTKVVSFTELKNKIAAAFYILKGAIFDVKNKNLRADGLKCGDCNQRTGSTGTLFEEYKFDDGDRCLDSGCFRNKTKVHLANVLEKRGIKIRKDHALEDDFNPAILISTQHDAPLDVLFVWFPNEEILKVSSYNSDSADARTVDKSDFGKCTGLEYGVWMDWNNKNSQGVSETVAICRRSSCCKKHWYASNSSYSSGTTPIKDLPAAEQETRRRERGARRQQILDSQVFHAIAKRAFRDVALKFGEMNGELFDSLPQAEFHLMLTWMFYNFKKADTGLSGWVINEVFKPVVDKKHFDELTKYSYEHPDYTKVFETWEQTRKISFWYAMMQAHQVRYYGDDLKPEQFQRLYDICHRFEIEWIGYDAEARKELTPAKYKKETEEFAAEAYKWATFTEADGNARPKTRPVRPFIYATDLQKEEMLKAAVSDEADKIVKKAKTKTTKKRERIKNSLPPIAFKKGDLVVLVPFSQFVYEILDAKYNTTPEGRLTMSAIEIEKHSPAVLFADSVRIYDSAKDGKPPVETLDPNDPGIGEAMSAAESDLELEDFDNHEEIDENDLEETSQG